MTAPTTTATTTSSSATTAGVVSSADAQQQLMRVDLSQTLNSKGPIVKVVVLRCSSSSNDNDDDEKKCSKDDDNDKCCYRHPVLTNLIEEIEIDTTPKKSEVELLLGGRFTFIGQYEDEGIIL